MTLDSNRPAATPRLRAFGSYATMAILGIILLFIGWVIFIQYRIQSQGLAL